MQTELPLTPPEGRPFDPPEELVRLSTEEPLARMTYPDGHVGWLATGHATVRAVLADSRFSVQPRLMHMPIPGMGGPEDAPPQLPGEFTSIDPPDHTRYRRLLTGQFTVRRMRLLTERIEEIAAGLLDDMERQGPPLDLVKAYAQPLPALVICELLGVPAESRTRFQDDAMTLVGSTGSTEDMGKAWMSIQEFIGELVPAKRAQPTDDLLSGLTESDLTDEELANIGVVLLSAGFDTTANMLSMGTFALLRNPGQRAAVLKDPSKAAEELLRYLTIIPMTLRAALEDVEIDGHVIKAGETVALALNAANRDPGKYPDPDRLDLAREASGQTSFGHGIHQCLGQQLARVEMTVGFPALFERFPSLCLAVPSTDVPFRQAAVIGGVDRLPVAW